MYESWRETYRALKREHPNKSDMWCSQQIAKTAVLGPIREQAPPKLHKRGSLVLASPDDINQSARANVVDRLPRILVIGYVLDRNAKHPCVCLLFPRPSKASAHGDRNQRNCCIMKTVKATPQTKAMP